jgi:hypothetical protein
MNLKGVEAYLLGEADKRGLRVEYRHEQFKPTPLAEVFNEAVNRRGALVVGYTQAFLVPKCDNPKGTSMCNRGMACDGCHANPENPTIVATGVTYCSAKDQFSRQRGRIEALSRALRLVRV